MPNLGSATSAASLEHAALVARAVKLRRQGSTIREVAAAIGRAPSSTFALIAGELKTLAAESREAAEEYRQLELDRLDALTRALWPLATGEAVSGRAGDGPPITPTDPDLDAVEKLLKVMARRSALLGLDAPAEVRHGGAVGAPPIELAAIASAITLVYGLPPGADSPAVLVSPAEDRSLPSA